MPITAIWFILVGAAVSLIGTAVALVDRSERGEHRALNVYAVAAGVYLGPAIYLLLFLLSAFN